MCDYKQNEGLISDKLHEKQEPVVQKIRELLGAETLAVNKTFHQLNYFSVWKLKT